jgi:hypothetical protein
MPFQGYGGGQQNVGADQTRDRNDREGSNSLRTLPEDNPAMQKNAEVILTFVDILKFITPEKGKEEN